MVSSNYYLLTRKFSLVPTTTTTTTAATSTTTSTPITTTTATHEAATVAEYIPLVIQAPSPTQPGTKYTVRAIPHTRKGNPSH